MCVIKYAPTVLVAIHAAVSQDTTMLNADNQCIGEYTCIFVCLHFGTCL